MCGSEVRSPASVTMPLSHRQARRLGQLARWAGCPRRRRRCRRAVRCRRPAAPTDTRPVPRSCRTSAPKSEGDAVAAVQVGEDPGDLVAEDPLQRQVGGLHHGHRRRRAGGRRRRSPDRSSPHRSPRGGAWSVRASAIRSESAKVRRYSTPSRSAPGTARRRGRRAGGQQQLVVSEPLAVGQGDLAGAAVDAGDPGRGTQLDVVRPRTSRRRARTRRVAAWSPSSRPLDSGGRSYGRSGSSPSSTTRPSKPSSRRVWAALAPARPAPTMTNVGLHAASPNRLSGFG